LDVHRNMRDMELFNASQCTTQHFQKVLSLRLPTSRNELVKFHLYNLMHLPRQNVVNFHISNFWNLRERKVMFCFPVTFHFLRFLKLKTSSSCLGRNPFEGLPGYSGPVLGYITLSRALANPGGRGLLPLHRIRLSSMIRI